jgi:sugar phosphate isomerase/epimerase
MISRRSFLTSMAAASAALPLVAQRKKVPVGLELYSVRQDLAKDLIGTVRAVAKMGYEVVEFYSPYYAWTPDYAREVRKLMDDLGIRCLSTHNDARAFAPEGIDQAIELNGIMGSRYIVMASAGRASTVDDWKKVAERLNGAAEKMNPAGMRPGYHNHQLEFKALEGTRPIDVIAENTDKSIVLQLDVGTCVEVGQDPVAWIRKNPGRLNCIHCKEWSPEPGKGYRVMFGEGAAPWKEIFQAAESTGGVEFYLIEQEGSDVSPFEAAAKCLANFRELHGA